MNINWFDDNECSWLGYLITNRIDDFVVWDAQGNRLEIPYTGEFKTAVEQWCKNKLEGL
jgi:hypothetical protein